MIAGEFGATSAIKAVQTAHNATKSRMTRAIASWNTSDMKQLDPRRPIGKFFQRRDIPSYISARSFADAVTEMIHDNAINEKIEALPEGVTQASRAACPRG